MILDNGEQELVILKSDGFRIELREEKDGVLVYNECEPMERQTFENRLYYSLHDHDGNEIFVSDSLSRSTHDTRILNIDDPYFLSASPSKTRRKIGIHGKSEYLNSKKPFVYKYEFHKDGCHLDIRFEQYIN